MARTASWLIDPDDNNARYNAACTYAQLGEIDQAIDLLEEWVQARRRRNSKAGSCTTPTWIPIRDHPRYPALLDKIEKVANGRTAAHSKQPVADEPQPVVLAACPSRQGLNAARWNAAWPRSWPPTWSATAG